MKRKHTPSPWIINEGELIGSGKTLLTEFYNSEDFAKNPNRDDILRLPTQEEFAANIKLAAASPDLLDVVLQFRQYMLSKQLENTLLFKQIQLALSKAL